MARLRFPGRPGYRFGRLGIKYGPDESKASVEFGLKLITNVQRGLRYFHELYGDSDEDEFDGFSEAEVACVVKKLQDLENELQELTKPVVQQRELSDPLTKSVSTCPSLQKQGKLRHKKTAEKTYKQLIKDGHAQPLKKMLEKTGKDGKQDKREKVRQRFHFKGAKIKISLPNKLDKSVRVKRKYTKRVSTGDPDKSVDSDDDNIKYSLSFCDIESETKEETVPKVKRGRGRPPVLSNQKLKDKRKKPIIIPKSKKVDTTLAKQLLDKAKKVKQERKRNSPPGFVPKRQFVLPTVSSRSSRIIIPNKRFIEDGVEGVIFTSPVTKSSQNGSEADNKRIPVLVGSPAVKRGRKPSVKVLQKLSDEDLLDRSKVTKPTSKKISYQTDQESKATQKRGRSILQKAKLRLNQATLNKSKVALARSLKRQMKKDDQKSQSMRNQKDTAQVTVGAALAKESALKPLKAIHVVNTPLKIGSLDKTPKFGTVSMPHVPLINNSGNSTQTFGESTTAKEPDKPTECLVCHDPCADSQNNMTSSGLCRLCKRAYNYNLKTKVLLGKKETRRCKNNGNCVLDYSKGRKAGYCSECRFKQSAQVLGVSAGQMESDNKDLDTTVEDFEALQSPQPPELLSPTQSESEATGKPRRPSVGLVASAPSESQPEDNLPSTDTKSQEQVAEAESGHVTQSLVDFESSPAHGATADIETFTPAAPGQLIAEGSVEDVEVVDDCGQARGPRIKHVCRRASIAFGKPRATFPFTLSALPNTEKEKILAVEAAAQGEESESELSMDEIISRAQEKDEDIVTLSNTQGDGRPAFRKLSKKSWGMGDEDFEWGGNDLTEDDDFAPHRKRPKIKYRRFKATPLGEKQNNTDSPSVGKCRRVRCRKCPGCLADDCRKCSSCKDMKKYGGPGRLKQTCVRRKCRSPQLPNSSKYDPDTGYRLPKQKSPKSSPSKSPGKAPKRSYHRKGDKKKDTTGEDKQETENSGQKKDSGKATDADCDTPAVGESDTEREELRNSEDKGKKYSPSKRPALSIGVECKSKKVKKKLRQEENASASGEKTGRIMTKLPPLVTSKKKFRDPSRPRPKYASHPDSHMIKLQYQADYSMEKAYQEGVALISTLPFSTRLLCLLCGSAGQYKLCFCAVCCEPFHSFCLDPQDRPRKDDVENWCCPRCQFCHVCGKQENLLKCTKCADTYHSGCLGSNYPTKPTKQKVWLCARCVKCKSCGRTTPGDSPTATWSHDFTLCADCGRLKDQGHYCPVCHQCYSTDDWDSQMIQCLQCNSWVHSKCEKLTDEMYEIFSLLPEDIPFVCRVCSPSRPAPHETIIQDEMCSSFRTILESLLTAKCADYLDSIVEEPDNKELSSVNLDTPESDAAVDRGRATSPLLGESDARTPVTTMQNFNEGTKPPSIVNIKPDRVVMPREVTRTMSQELGLSIHDDVESTDSIPTDTSSEGSKPTTPLIFGSGISSTGKEMGETHSKTGLSKKVKEREDTYEDESQEATVEKGDGHGIGSLRRGLRSRSGSSSSNSNTSKQREDLVDVETVDTTDETKENKEKSVVKFSNETTVKSFTVVEKKDYPRDLVAVKERFDMANYTKVADFCSDIVRILRYNIGREDPLVPGLTKACQTARSLFLKQMKKCFPWYNANTNTLWDHDRTLPDGMLPDAILPPSEDHTYAQWRERDQPPQSPPMSPFKRPPGTPGSPMTPFRGVPGSPRTWAGVSGEDVRKCALCREFGDHKSNERGRLVYVGQNEWLHLNCCLWSSIVFENMNGTLQNVFTALSYGRHLVCVICEKKGATVGCCAQGCRQNFHMMCARQAGSVFQTDKNVYCRLHKSHMNGTIMDPEKFSVERRACVDMNTNKWGKNGGWRTGVKSSTIQLLVGAMCLESLGHLTQLSDTKSLLLPLDYSVTRVYWSTKDARRKCIYTCRIVEVDPHLEHARLHMKDTTVIHDPEHPRFNRELHLQYTTNKPVSSVKDKDTLPIHIDSNTTPKQASSWVTLDPLKSVSRKLPTGVSRLQGCGNLSASWPGTKPSQCYEYSNSAGGDKVPHLSSPPPVSRARPSSAPIERSGLVQKEDEKDNEEEFGLLALVNRLNRAASKNRRRSREKSTDRCSSHDSSGTRTASREGSIERSLYSPPPSGSVTPSGLMSPPLIQGRTTPNLTSGLVSPLLIQGRTTPNLTKNNNYNNSATTEPLFGDPSSSLTLLKPITEEAMEKTEGTQVREALSVLGSKTLDVHKRSIPAGAKPIGLVVQGTRSKSPSLQHVANTAGLKMISSGATTSTVSTMDSSQTSSGARVMHKPRVMQKYVAQRSISPNLAVGIASSLTGGSATLSGISSTVIMSNGKPLVVRSNRHSVSGTSQHQTLPNHQEESGAVSGQKKARSLSTSSIDLPTADHGDVYTSRQVITVRSSAGVRTVAPVTINKPKYAHSESPSLQSYQMIGEDILIDPQSIIRSGATVTPLQNSDNIPQIDGLVDDKQSSQDANLREKVVQKIKAESLARRSPVDHSPVKCKICKRVYRTLESYNIHVKTCDFVVSSEEDEEEEEEGYTNLHQAVLNEADIDVGTGRNCPPRRNLPSTSSDMEWTPKGSGRKQKKSPPKGTKGKVVRRSRGRPRSTSVEKGAEVKGKAKKPHKVPEVKGKAKKVRSPGEDTADKPQIMYQGVKLIKPPFKRAPGRPRKMKPVLVVPPQRREQPQDHAESEEEDFEDEEENELQPAEAELDAEQEPNEGATVYQVGEHVSVTIQQSTLSPSSPSEYSKTDKVKETPECGAFVNSEKVKPDTTKSPTHGKVISVISPSSVGKCPTSGQQKQQIPSEQQATVVVNVHPVRKETSPTLTSKFCSPIGQGQRRLSESPQVERVSPFQVITTSPSQRRSSKGDGMASHSIGSPLLPQSGTSVLQTDSKPQSGTSVLQTDSKPESGTSVLQTDSKPESGTSVLQTDSKPESDTSVLQTDSKPESGTSVLQADSKPQDGSDTDDCIILDSEPEDLVPKASPHSAKLPKTSPPIAELPKTSPPIAKFSKTSPPIAEFPKTSPPIAKFSKTSPPIAEFPKTSPPIAKFSKTSPPIAKFPKTSPPIAKFPKTSPQLAKFSKTSPPIAKFPKTSPPSATMLPAEIKKTLERLGKTVKSVRIMPKTPPGKHAKPGESSQSLMSTASRLINVSQSVVVQTINKGVHKYSSLTAQTDLQPTSVSTPRGGQAASVSTPHSTDLQQSGHVTLVSPQTNQCDGNPHTESDTTSQPRNVILSSSGSSVVVTITSSQTVISPPNLKPSLPSTSSSSSTTRASGVTVSCTQALPASPRMSVSKQATVTPGQKHRPTASPVTSPRALLPKLAPGNLMSMLLLEDKQTKSLPSILKRTSPSKASEIRISPTTSNSGSTVSCVSPILPKLVSPVNPPTAVAMAVVSPQGTASPQKTLCLVSTGLNQYKVVQESSVVDEAPSSSINQTNTSFVTLKSIDGALHMVPHSMFQGNQPLQGVGMPVQILQQAPQLHHQPAAQAHIVVSNQQGQTLISAPQMPPPIYQDRVVASGSTVISQNTASVSHIPTINIPGQAGSVSQLTTANIVRKDLQSSGGASVSVSLGLGSVSRPTVSKNSADLWYSPGNKSSDTIPSIPTPLIDYHSTGSQHTTKTVTKQVRSNEATQSTSYKRKIFTEDKTQTSLFKKPRIDTDVKSSSGQHVPGSLIPAVGSMQDDIRRRLYAARYKAGLVGKGYDELRKKTVAGHLTSKVDASVRPAHPAVPIPHPIVYKEKHKRLSLSAKKKASYTDPLTENLRIAATSHHLVQLSRKTTTLPEPAVEEEVKEVPMYTIFGKPGLDNPNLKGLCTRKDRPHLRFEIESDDGFKVQADNWDDAWKAVTEKVQDARTNARMKQLSFTGVSGLSMFGLNHSATVYLVEQLFGAHKCRNYNFKYHHYEHDSEDEEPEENASGCARTECYTGERKPYDMFSFLMSRYRSRPLFVPTDDKPLDMAHKSQRRITSLELPLPMRFRHLRMNAKEAVGVFRSGIHGRGLFCKREIDAGEMVIEYAGEIFRSNLTDKREKFYESKSIGCYMFRVDDEFVIDATLRGNAARFINHSCDPNCYSKVIQVDAVKHIVIFALKRIQKGEELTYDYKFPIEDVKIPCSCTAKKCRKYLN